MRGRRNICSFIVGKEKVMLTDTLVDIVVDQIRPELDASLTVVPTKDFAAYRMGVSTLLASS